MDTTAYILYLLPWIVGFLFFFYFHHIFYLLIVINNTMENIDKPVNEIEQKRERLLYVVGSGQSNLFFGKVFTIEQVEKWDDKAVNKVFKIYEAKYSSLLSDSVTRSFIDLGATAIGRVVPIDDKDSYTTDLKKDFILNSELKKVTGRIAYTWGPLLALFSTGLITGKHLDFDFKKLNNIFNGGRERGDNTDTAEDNRESYFTEEKPRQSSCGEEVSRMEQTKQIEEVGAAGASASGDAIDTLVQ